MQVEKPFQQGAMIIGILSVLSVPIFLGTILVKDNDGERLPLPIELFEVVVQVVVLSLFFYGMSKEKERFLIPYIVYEVRDPGSYKFQPFSGDLLDQGNGHHGQWLLQSRYSPSVEERSLCL